MMINFNIRLNMKMLKQFHPNKKNPPIVPTTNPTAANTAYPILDYDFEVGVLPFV